MWIFRGHFALVVWIATALAGPWVGSAKGSDSAPADAELVVTVDWRRIGNSELFKGQPQGVMDLRACLERARASLVPQRFRVVHKESGLAAGPAIEFVARAPALGRLLDGGVPLPNAALAREFLQVIGTVRGSITLDGKLHFQVGAAAKAPDTAKKLAAGFNNTLATLRMLVQEKSAKDRSLTPVAELLKNATVTSSDREIILGGVARMGLLEQLLRGFGGDLALSGARTRTSQSSASRVLADLRDNSATLTRRGLNWLLQREYAIQLMFLATDKKGGTGGGGWYRPSQSRFDWDWLSDRLDQDGDEAISFEEFSGPREWFEALDKDRDGQLTGADFAWFGASALAKAGNQAKSLFYRIDRDSDGQVTLDEWKLWFDSLKGTKPFLAQDDLLPLFMDTKRGWGKKGKRDRLPVVVSYISGDVGSPCEGPGLNEPAPDFTLTRMETGGLAGKLAPKRLRLSEHRGKKPLVLIFGSFT